MNNQLTTRVKHAFRQNMFRANDLVQKNWLKLVVVLLVAFVIAHKDLNISLNLVNSNNNQMEQTSPTSVSNSPKAEPIGFKEGTFSVKDAAGTPIVGAEKDKKAGQETQKSAKPKDDNLANTFSNVGFILNPTYAKRNNINPAIVAQKQKICEDYVKRFAPQAVAEMKKYGIPASITLAQGLLESNAGASKLAVENNNHFGIKCFSRDCKPGHCSNYTDDSHKDFFRIYKSVEQSYQAHSIFLQRSRYIHLKELDTKNYKKWAHGLRKAGYATDKKYGPKLIRLIETLKLNRFDQ